MSAQTRDQLMDAAVSLTATSGARALTARAIATEAGVNQALIFYHFGGVDELLRQGYLRATAAMVQDFSDALSAATTFSELYAIGENLAQRARTDGSASVLTSVLAAAHHDPAMAESLAGPLGLWLRVVTDTVERILASHGLSDVVDGAALSRSLSASTIGMIAIDALPGAPMGETLRSARDLPKLLDTLVTRLPRTVIRRFLVSLNRRA